MEGKNRLERQIMIESFSVKAYEVKSTFNLFPT